jgi:hypothetical protein
MMVGMNRFTRSFALAKASWGVLRSEPSLFAFPVVAFLVNALVMVASFVVIALVGITTTSATSGTANDVQTYGMTIVGWIAVLVMYIVMAFVTTLFLGALVIGARERLQGGDPTFGSALRGALEKSPYLLAWAAVQGTVSWILNAISRNGGILGSLVSGLLGAAWSVLTFLTIPIIVAEDAGPIRALKRSGTLLKQTWGENLIGQVGLGIVGFLACLPGVALLIGGIALAGPAPAAGFPMLGVAVLYLALAAAFLSAMSGVYRTALYEYATTGQTPEAFGALDLQHAFRARAAR